MDVSGDLSGILEDNFWTRRHGELQQRIQHVEMLKQSLLQQLQERRETLDELGVRDVDAAPSSQAAPFPAATHPASIRAAATLPNPPLSVPTLSHLFGIGLPSNPAPQVNSLQHEIAPIAAFSDEMAPIDSFPDTTLTSRHGQRGFDLSTIVEGDSTSLTDSFHGLPYAQKTAISQLSHLLDTFDNWKSLASETFTSLETGKISRYVKEHLVFASRI